LSTECTASADHKPGLACITGSEAEEFAPQRVLVKALPVVGFPVQPVLAEMGRLPFVEIYDVMIAGSQRLLLADRRDPILHGPLVGCLQLVQFLLKIR
jgi:hypothetical protein